MMRVKLKRVVVVVLLAVVGGLLIWFVTDLRIINIALSRLESTSTTVVGDWRLGDVESVAKGKTLRAVYLGDVQSNCGKSDKENCLVKMRFASKDIGGSPIVFNVYAGGKAGGQALKVGLVMLNGLGEIELVYVESGDLSRVLNEGDVVSLDVFIVEGVVDGGGEEFPSRLSRLRQLSLYQREELESFVNMFNDAERRGVLDFLEGFILYRDMILPVMAYRIV